MGLAERDYMRERAGSARHAWPSKYDRALRQQRRRAGASSARPQGQILLWVLMAAATVIGTYTDAKREGWVSDWRREVPFPNTGDVTVNADINPRTATSNFAVETANANAVAQLFTLTDEHIITIYVRKNSEVTTPVPPGKYRLKIAEGQKWYGPKRMFGHSMTDEEAVETVEITRRRGYGIDLHRRPYGDLKTRPNWRRKDLTR